MNSYLLIRTKGHYIVTSDYIVSIVTNSDYEIYHLQKYCDLMYN